MARIATDTGNKITAGYVVRIDSIEEYFETEAGALAWSKAGNIPSVSFYTDSGISDEAKLDDLTYGNLMEYSENL